MNYAARLPEDNQLFLEFTSSFLIQRQKCNLFRALNDSAKRITGVPYFACVRACARARVHILF